MTTEKPMRNIDSLFRALSQSSFRRRFRLNARDRAYLDDKGLPIVLVHARQFIDQRLRPAQSMNDGKQTPMRGHPVFVAQHATASCCRSCLQKWHGIDKRHALTDEEVEHVMTMIGRWLAAQTDIESSGLTLPNLFTQPSMSGIRREAGNALATEDTEITEKE